MAQDQPADRIRLILAGEEEFEVDMEHLSQEMVDWGTVLRLVGGSLVIVAERQEVAEDTGIYATRSVRARWKSGGPPRHKPVAVPAPELSEEEMAEHFPEPEPATAG